MPAAESAFANTLVTIAVFWKCEREKSEEKDRTQKQTVVTAANERPAGNRKLSFKERRELEELERRIAEMESRKAEAEAELAANGSDHVLVASLYDELQSLNEKLDRDMERWAELGDLEPEPTK